MGGMEMARWRGEAVKGPAREWTIEGQAHAVTAVAQQVCKEGGSEWVSPAAHVD